eukprot:TRINITY_DN39701_c0_g1_i1.p1 TRINITY_DN39701_c0_g1~~TRINITY_DN39701_c0_g1_i1.p1  ORF type:complete len:364 (-),score=53.76 TRINITY_DN39701_c0_g1_i1:65-1156(-)
MGHSGHGCGSFTSGIAMSAGAFLLGMVLSSLVPGVSTAGCLSPVISGSPELKLISRSPHVLHYPDFLSESEVQALMLAAAPQFEASSVSHEEFQLLEAFEDTSEQLPFDWVLRMLRDATDIPGLSTDDVRSLLRDTAWNGQSASGREIRTVPNERVQEWMSTILESPEHFHKHNRKSETSWVETSAWPRSVIQKLMRTLDVPAGLISHSEPLQVVRYHPKGQYRCHHDSALEGDADPGSQRIITALMVLKAPESGGETWFPYATNHTTRQERSVQEWEELETECRINSTCANGLVIPARVGSMVVWLNHPAAQHEGFESQLDWSTIHSGCQVGGGEKWIGNLWIPRRAVDRFCGSEGREPDEL